MAFCEDVFSNVCIDAKADGMIFKSSSSTELIVKWWEHHCLLSPTDLSAVVHPMCFLNFRLTYIFVCHEYWHASLPCEVANICYFRVAILLRWENLLLNQDLFWGVRCCILSTYFWRLALIPRQIGWSSNHQAQQSWLLSDENFTVFFPRLIWRQQCEPALFGHFFPFV